VVLSEGLDKVSWSLEEHGRFSVSSMYNTCDWHGSTRSVLITTTSTTFLFAVTWSSPIIEWTGKMERLISELLCLTVGSSPLGPSSNNNSPSTHELISEWYQGDDGPSDIVHARQSRQPLVQHRLNLWL
jgi:hypothetical protein